MAQKAVWFNKIMQKMSGGFFSIGSMVNVAAGSIVTERDKYFTEEGVFRLYAVTEMPFEYAESLIVKLSERITKINPDLVVKSYFEIHNVSIPINTPQFVGRMNRLTNKYVNVKKQWNLLDDDYKKAGLNFNNGIRRIFFNETHLTKMAHQHFSFTEVNNHIKHNGGVYFTATIFLTVGFPDLEAFRGLDTQVQQIIKGELQKSLQEIAIGLGKPQEQIEKLSTMRQTGIAHSIDKTTATILANFGPAVNNYGGAKMATMLVSERNLTQLIPFRHEGIVADEGVPIGVNPDNNTPLWLPMFSSPEGSSTIVCGKAGSGKSFMSYVLALNLVGMGNTVVYIDLKGTEVTECLGAAMDNIKTIDFSEKNGQFVNTMIISKDIPDYTMSDAVKATAEMLSIFVNLQKEEGNDTDLLGILRGAVRSYYNTVGVKEDNVDTWHFSQEMNFKTLLSFISSQKDSSEESEFYIIITNRLAEAFMTYHINNNHRNLQLQDLLSYSVISFNFNKNTEVRVSLIDQVRIYMVMMVTKRLAKLNKQNDLFTLLFAEEAQRYGDLPVLCQGLSDLASGSRSDNLSIIAIMNDLNIMRKEEMSAFRANVANFVIGKVDAEGIRVLRDVFKKEILAEKVSAIIENPKRFNRIFAVHFSIGDVELNLYNRCDVPKSVADLFKTRSVMQD